MFSLLAATLEVLKEHLTAAIHSSDATGQCLLLQAEDLRSSEHRKECIAQVRPNSKREVFEHS